MARWHVSEITVEALPSPCRDCTFWEAGNRPPSELGQRDRTASRVAKESWWQATSLEWGACGVGVWHGRELDGYAMIAPASYVEGAGRFGRVTDDALLLSTLWRRDDQDERSAGMLVEAGLRMVAARGARALEAFGSPGGAPSCVPSANLLRSCGFDLLERRYPYAHYRLDLRQTARWREGLEEALVGVRRVLRGGRRLGRVPSMPSAVSARGR